jgi:hypothetical protein
MPPAERKGKGLRVEISFLDLAGQFVPQIPNFLETTLTCAADVIQLGRDNDRAEVSAVAWPASTHA